VASYRLPHFLGGSNIKYPLNIQKAPSNRITAIEKGSKCLFLPYQLAAGCRLDICMDTP